MPNRVALLHAEIEATLAVWGASDLAERTEIDADLTVGIWHRGLF
jgi:hypothetical protein